MAFPSVKKFGLPPLEAGALKVPVVCSNSSSLSDYSFFGKNHVNPADYDVFKNTLSDVLTNKPCEDALTAIAEKIQQDYCWQKTADNFYQLLKQNSLS